MQASYVVQTLPLLKVHWSLLCTPVLSSLLPLSLVSFNLFQFFLLLFLVLIVGKNGDTSLLDVKKKKDGVGLYSKDNFREKCISWAKKFI